MAERAIKTIKDMLYKRMKHETDKPWYQLVHEILVVLNYMRKSRAHGLTPKEARDPKNLTKVKKQKIIELNIENIKKLKQEIRSGFIRRKINLLTKVSQSGARIDMK